MGLKFDKSSLRTLEANLQKFSRSALEGGAKGLSEHAKDVMNKSQAEVPAVTGTLKGSNFIEVPSVNENTKEVSIKLGYGGPADTMNPVTGEMASQYMIAVHEVLHARHPTGKAKFLEDPVMNSAPELEAKVSMFVKEKMAKTVVRRLK